MTRLTELFAGVLPKLVMFDLDGTLLDSVPDLAQAVDAMLAALDRPAAGVAAVRTWVGNGSKVLVRRALAGQMEHSAVDEREANEAHRLFLAAYAGSHAASTVYPGVRECLDFLRAQGVQLALVTNKPYQFVGPLLAEKGLAGYFNWLVGGDSLPAAKPDPLPLNWVLQQAQVSCDQALFVGDSRNDVRAARAAKVRCVALSYGYNHGQPIAQEGPDCVLDDLRALVA